MDDTTYPAGIASLLLPQRLPALGPGSGNRAVRDKLAAATVDRLFHPHIVHNQLLATCCHAGLWLYHDYVDEAHQLVDAMEVQEGYYWHGIVHRREPDYGNAKYWFRRVGKHRTFEPLRAVAAQKAAASQHLAGAFLTTQREWDPFAFIDLCQAAAQDRSSSEMLCRQIQLREWELLFSVCFHGAIRNSS